MAEPFSIAVGVFAVIQASAKTAQGFERAWRLRHRDREFRELETHITGLRLQLRAVHQSLTSIKTNNNDSQLFQDCLSDIEKLAEQASELISEVNSFVEDVNNAGQDGSSKPGKREWMRKKTPLSRLTSRAALIMTSLVAVIQILHTCISQAPAEASTNISIQKIEFVQNGVCNQDPANNLPQRVESQLEQAATRAIQSDTICDTALDSSRSVDSDSSDTLSSSSTLVAIRGTVEAAKCNKVCPCQCHSSSQIKTPDWAKYFIGSITFTGNGSIFLSRRPCDIKSCGRCGTASMQISYYAPARRFLGAYSFYVQAKSLKGLSSAVFLHKVQVIPRHAPVWSVVRQGKLQELRKMIDAQEASPKDVGDNGTSVLYWAAFHGQVETYSYLVSEGADEDLKDEFGVAPYQPGLDRTLSHMGLDRDYFNVIKGDLNSTFTTENAIDNQGFTLVHRIILDMHGMSLNDYLNDIGTNIDTPDVNGRTPLLWAAWRGDSKNVKALLDSRADANRADNEGFTPLAKAAKAGRLECVQLLLRANADVTISTSWGTQPIHYASGNRSHGAAIVHELLQVDENLVQELGDDGSPLHYAAISGSLQAAKHLVSAGAVVDALSASGITAVMLALACFNESVFTYLVEAGAALNIARVTGETILHAAAWSGMKTHWEVLARAASEGRMIGVDTKALHRGHDLWYCLGKCRNTSRLGELTKEELIFFECLVHQVEDST